MAPICIARDLYPYKNDWEKVIYQIIFDLRRGWTISSDCNESEDAIGQSLLLRKYGDMLYKEGLKVHRSKCDEDEYNELLKNMD